MSDKLKKYIAFDLIAFSVLIVITEMASLYIENSSVNDIFFTFSILLSAIILYRWNILGLISIALGYFVTTLFLIKDFDISILEGILVYYLPYLSLGSIALLFKFLEKKCGKKIFMKNIGYKIIYFILPFLVIGLSKGIFSFILVQDNPISVLIYFIFRYHFLSIVVSVVLGCLLTNHNNFIYDQLTFIEDLKKEEELRRQEESRIRGV